MDMLDYENKPLKVGQRIELHPGTDLWMRGARFGEVVRLWKHPTTGATLVTVKLDKIKTRKVFSNDNVRALPAAATVEPKAPAHIVVVGATSLVWMFPGKSGAFKDREEYETARVLNPCPNCGKTMTLTALPPPLLAIQPDKTTHICFSGIGGCNHGFEV